MLKAGGALQELLSTFFDFRLRFFALDFTLLIGAAMSHVPHQETLYCE